MRYKIKFPEFKSLLSLAKETFLISMFTFGGGYVIVPLLKKKFVDELGLLAEEEMLNMIAVAQSSPGALAVNVAIILGYKLYGFIGSVVACFSTVLPPLIIITIISYCYDSFRSNIYVHNALIGMAAGVAATIVYAVYGMVKPKLKHKRDMILLIIALVLSYFVNTMLIILGAIVIGVLHTLYLIRKEQKQWFYYNFIGLSSKLDVLV